MVDRLCRPTFAELVKEFEKMVQDPSRYLVLKVGTAHIFTNFQLILKITKFLL